MIDTVQDIEANILESKQFVEMGEALTRLEDNRDFKLLIAKGYFKDEAVRLVSCLSDPAFQTKDRQASLVVEMSAISGLNSYFRAVKHKAMVADAAIRSGREEIVAILAEQAEAGSAE